MRTGALAVFPLLICLALLAGCLDSTEIFVIRADGSGTHEGRFTAQLKDARQMAEMLRLMYRPGREKVEMPEPFGRAWYQHAAKGVEGYEILAAETTAADGRRTDRISARFTSVEAAVQAGMFVTSNVRLGRVRWRKPEAGDATEANGAKEARKPGDPAQPNAPGHDGEKPTSAPPAGGEAAWKLTLMESWASGTAQVDLVKWAPLFKTQLQKLKIVRRITFPARVLETNGTRSKDGRTVEWTMTYGNAIAGKAIEMTAVFADAPDIKLVPFSHQPDMMPLLRRWSDPPPKPGAESSGGTKPEKEGAAAKPEGK